MTNATIEDADLSLLSLTATFSRARGDRIYSSKKSHWVDLWKENGSYLTGRRPEGVLGVWKNQMEKGLGAVLPSAFPKRLESLARKRWPAARAVLFFRSAERAWSAAAKLAQVDPVSGFRSSWADPALTHKGKANLVLDRPWVDDTTTDRCETAALVWPLLPWGAANARILLIGKLWERDLEAFEGDLISGAQAAALIGALSGLRRVEEDPKGFANMRNVWAATDRFAQPLFQRRGPYWEALCDPADYEDLFKEFWDHGFLLPPDMSQPAILPTSLSDGELKTLQKSVEAFLEKEGKWIR